MNNPGIRIPKVSVHKRGFHNPALALERAEQTRYDFIKQDRDQHIQMRDLVPWLRAPGPGPTACSS